MHGGKLESTISVSEPDNTSNLKYTPETEREAYTLMLLGGYEVDNTKLGGKLSLDSSSKTQSTCYDRKKDELEAIKIAIIKDFLRNNKYLVLLGPMAVDWLDKGENICPQYDRLQLFGLLQPEELRQNINKYLTELGRNYQVNIGEEVDLIIPKDFRSIRTIYTISLNGKEKPFLEYFNCASFELIPIIRHLDVAVASREVLLRFLFIDMWVSKFIYGIGKMEKDSFIKRMTRLGSLVTKAHSFENKIDGIIGTYSDYEVEKKAMILGQDKRYFPYVPKLYTEKNNGLRNM
jgi:hypothetical protein